MQAENSSNLGQIGRHQLEGIIKTHPGLKPRNRNCARIKSSPRIQQESPAEKKQSPARHEEFPEKKLIANPTAINSKFLRDPGLN